MATLLPTLLLAALLAPAAHPSAHPPAALRSPWDLHPPRATSAAYSCPARAATTRTALLQAERAADTYRRTGSIPAADCALRILGHESRASLASLAPSALLQAKTLAALAVVDLKIRPGVASAAGSAARRARIQAWLGRSASAIRSRFASGPVSRSRAWAAFAVMAAAIAANRRPDYNWSVSVFSQSIHDIDLYGAIPPEMARGASAYRDHLQTAAALVMIAALGSANGQDLYNADHKMLHRLVDRCASGLYTTAWFQHQTGHPQNAPGPRLTAADAAWLRPYLRRFPDPGLSALLRTLPSLSALDLGGLPPR